MKDQHDKHRITIHGSDEDCNMLQATAPVYKVETERLCLLCNSVDASSSEVLTIAGTFYAIAKCVCSYLKKRKKRLEVLRPDMHVVLDNFSVDEIERIFKKGGYFYVRGGKKKRIKKVEQPKLPCSEPEARSRTHQ